MQSDKHNAAQHHTTPYHTRQDKTRQDKTRQDETRQGNATLSNATQPNTTQHHATQHNTTQHNTTQHNTTQHNTTQHNTTQHNTTKHNTTQHNTTQHNTTQHWADAETKGHVEEIPTAWRSWGRGYQLATTRRGRVRKLREGVAVFGGGCTNFLAGVWQRQQCLWSRRRYGRETGSTCFRHFQGIGSGQRTQQEILVSRLCLCPGYTLFTLRLVTLRYASFMLCLVHATPFFSEALSKPGLV